MTRNAFLLFLLVATSLATCFAGGAEIQLAVGTDCPLPFRVLASPSGKGGYELSLGDPVKLTLDKAKPSVDAVFLGRLVREDGTATDGVFYEMATDKMHFLPLKDLQMERADGSVLDSSKTFPLVKPVKQEGPTCSSFADFNCLLTIRERTGGKGVAMKTQGQRFQLLSQALSDTYSARFFGVALQRFDDYVVGAHLKLHRDSLPSDPEHVKAAVLESVEAGWPVILDYTSGPWKAQPFKTIQYGDGKPKEVGGHGQWLPYKRLSLFNRLKTLLGLKVKEPSGHAVVVIGVVEGPKGSRKLLVLDPNWEYPVLWDVNELDHGARANFRATKFSWEPKPEEEKKSPETAGPGGS